MNEEYYRRQAENQQEHQHPHNSPHSTMETYQLEQQDAHSGHLPSSEGTDAEPPAPTLWQRIKKMLGMK
jgi:hypothetical protein